MTILQNRELLNSRHRLSHQQIDYLFNEKPSADTKKEKIFQLSYLRHFIEVTDLIRNANISFICLKGPLLSYRIYNDASTRITHDIDLLIKKQDIEKTLQLLFENNFTTCNSLIWPKNKTQQKLLIKGIKHLALHNKTRNIYIEIHWLLISKPPLSEKKLDKIIYNNLTNTNFADRSFTVFTKEFELIFLILHGSSHSWNRLKWLIDIKDYSFNDFNTDKFLHFVKIFHASKIITQTNRLLNDIFNTKLPFKIKDNNSNFLFNYSVKSINKNLQKDDTKRSLSYYYYHWLLFTNIYYKINVFRKKLYRPHDLTKINSSLAIAYYLYRPYSFIKRRILHA